MTYILRFGSKRKNTGSAIDCTYWFRIWQEKYLPFIPHPPYQTGLNKKWKKNGYIPFTIPSNQL